MANGRGGGRGLGRMRRTVLYPKSMASAVFESNLSTSFAELKRAVREKVLRSATHAGAVVFYKEMRLRVPVDKGTLYASIYRWHDDKRSNGNRQFYLVGPNKAKAPHWYNVEYGHWLYNKNIAGRWQRSKSNPNARGPGAHDLAGALPVPKWVPAQPYIRPTFDAAVGKAIAAMKARAGERFADVLSGRLQQEIA